MDSKIGTFRKRERHSHLMHMHKRWPGRFPIGCLHFLKVSAWTKKQLKNCNLDANFIHPFRYENESSKTHCFEDPLVWTEPEKNSGEAILMQRVTVRGARSEWRNFLVRVNGTNKKIYILKKRLAKYLYPLKEIAVIVYKSRFFCSAQYI